jgi:hypothetical protein
MADSLATFGGAIGPFRPRSDPIPGAEISVAIPAQ